MTTTDIPVDVNLDLIMVRDIRDRVGKFYVGYSQMERWSVFSMMSLFKNFIILHAVPDPMSRRTEYMAVSILFDQVEEGMRPPTYTVEMSYDGTINVRRE